MAMRLPNFIQSAVTYGNFICIPIVFGIVSGCSLAGHGANSQGPVRGDNPISGDLTNADITINDPKVLYFVLATGIISIVGFVLIFWRLQKHHRSIYRASVPVTKS